MIKIIPAIDIIGGRCVRLTKGDYSSTRVYDASPVEMTKAYAACGVSRIHLVDLDGAKASQPCNLATLEKIASAVDCELEWGGGIANEAALESVFSAGASHAIIGSVAALHPELFEQWLSAHPGHMVLGADVRDRKIAVKGWLESTAISIEELLDRFGPLGLEECICTDISRDGMLQGPSDQLYTELQSSYPGISFTVSGGVSGMDDIRRLDSLKLRKVIVGKAIYENRITLKDIESWSQKG